VGVADRSNAAADGGRPDAKLNEQLLKIVEDYRAGGTWPATRDQIAEWAVANDRYQLTRGMAVSQCAERIGRAMGLEHIKNKKARSVRKYYAARIRDNGQLVMKWDDYNAERPFMEVAAANRRNQILGQCWQLRTTWTATASASALSSPSRWTSISTSTLRNCPNSMTLARSIFPPRLRSHSRDFGPLFRGEFGGT
jgi:hypothetical protein